MMICLEATFTKKYSDKSKLFLQKMLLQQKITLQEIPHEVRANSTVYAGAIRVSRNFYDLFIADIKTIMADILQINALPNSYLHKQELSSIVSLLETQLSLFDFKGSVNLEKFEKEVYQPFLQELKSTSSASKH